MDDEDHYEYITAEIVEGSQLNWTYKVVGLDTEGSMSHDEDVTGWSDHDIRELTRAMLNVDDDDPVKIEITSE